MEDERSPRIDNPITLISGERAPYGFTASIAWRKANGDSAYSFKITGTELATGSIKTRDYRLAGTEHNSYLNLFQNLAQDFGLRLPRNRRPAAVLTSQAKYRALLTENLAPGILYGYGDPAVLRVEEEADPEQGVSYYLVVTSNDAPDSFPLIRSRDLINWECIGFVFPEGKQPDWVAVGKYLSDFWAPELHKVRGEFRVYFVARDRNTLELAIGMAKSVRPTGPFIAEKEPILTGNVIDPHVFVADADTAFLYWKEDNNDIWPSRLAHLLHEHPHCITELFPEREDQVTASFIQTLWPWIRSLQPMERFFAQQVLVEAVTSDFTAFHDRLNKLSERQVARSAREQARAVLQVLRTPVYAQRLSSDGLKLVGERVKIIENDQAWEAHLIEGMWVAEHQGRYYLFYAGNDFSTAEYGIGVAIADSPLGPYRKMPEPLLRSTNEWAGPGHPSITIGLDGEFLLFFHAFFPERTGYKEFRALLAAQIEFAADRVRLK
ncbi:MAG TPA: family 43 glycosylhydrolase [Pyrinomonadaceae bacterium]|nr:family 43 glycosylhydrolase [Pyrinomonadaceae bacterium]